VETTDASPRAPPQNSDQARDARARLATRDEAAAGIARLCVAIEVRKTTAGWYPESAGRADDVHRGVETLAEALGPTVRSRFEVADVDGDGRPELIDPWGRPFVYWRADDYALGQVIATSAGDGERAAASRAPDGEPRAARRFQLVSCGANGRYEGGAGDDVASWER
jgi:hypothetical protein